MLKRVFNRGAEIVNRLKTTVIPDATIMHWEGLCNYETHNHPVYFEIKRNKWNSYDIVRHVKDGLFWGTDEVERYLSKRKAVGILIDRQLHVMREFGGYKDKLTSGDLRQHIQNGKFPRNHIFAYVQKHPEAIDHYQEDYYPEYRKVGVPAPK